MRTDFEKRKKRVQGPAHLVKGRGFGDYRKRESQEIIHSSNLPKSESSLIWIFSLYSRTNRQQVQSVLPDIS